jgi:predicted lipoprotein
MNLTLAQYEEIYKLYPQVVRMDVNVAYDATNNVVQYDLNAINALIQANAYKAKRAAEYPSIPDQLDLLYHGGMDAWKTAIQAVKDKYPKG